MNADRWEAVVVGAGFAGLGAAVALRDSGAGVTVLEARDRVGGRVGSVRMPNGAVAELGAEFILPGNTAVIETAKRLGLEVADKGMRYGRREPRGGSPVDPRLFEDAVSALGGALSG
ncbi:MAG: FAD-dependent oxidoreductase, partial [Solirubrobacterales bacterium]